MNVFKHCVLSPFSLLLFCLWTWCLRWFMLKREGPKVFPLLIYSHLDIIATSWISMKSPYPFWEEILSIFHYSRSSGSWKCFLFCCCFLTITTITSSQMDYYLINRTRDMIKLLRQIMSKYSYCLQSYFCFHRLYLNSGGCICGTLRLTSKLQWLLWDFSYSYYYVSFLIEIQFNSTQFN